MTPTTWLPWRRRPTRLHRALAATADAHRLAVAEQLRASSRPADTTTPPPAPDLPAPGNTCKHPQHFTYWPAASTAALTHVHTTGQRQRTHRADDGCWTYSPAQPHPDA